MEKTWKNMEQLWKNMQKLFPTLKNNGKKTHGCTGLPQRGHPLASLRASVQPSIHQLPSRSCHVEELDDKATYRGSHSGELYGLLLM